MIVQNKDIKMKEFVKHALKYLEYYLMIPVSKTPDINIGKIKVNVKINVH
jgi:hypothetical protein